MSWRGARRAALLFAAAFTLMTAASLVEGERRVAAHANLIRSSPAPNAQLREPPDRVIVWFSEPVEAAFSEISVLDTEGRRVDNGDGRLDPTEPTAMLVSVPHGLPDGPYTVAWRNLSTVDGHKVRGSYLFSVGEPLAGNTAVAHDQQPLLQSIADPWLRWSVLVGLSLLVGGLAFEVLVTGPALADSEAGSAAARAANRLSGRLLTIAAVGLALAAVGAVGQLVQQASIAYETSWYRVLGEPARATLTESAWGRQWIARTALTALAGFALLAAGRLRRTRQDDETPGLLTDSVSGLLALLFGIGALLTITLGSHNAATPPDVRTPAVVSDLAHLLAAAIWVGGVAYLAMALPLLWRGMTPHERRDVLASIVPRFSTVAMLSAGVLIVTGLFSGWMQVTIPAAANTPYGWTMVAKIALVLPLIGLAAFNSFRLRPRLTSDDRAAGILRRLLRWEALAMLLVLLAVGWLASLEPARQYAGRKGIGVEQGASFTDTQEGMRMRLEVQPAEVGANTLTLKLHNRRGEPVLNASDVRIRTVFLDQDLGSELISAEEQGDGNLENQRPHSWPLRAMAGRSDRNQARRLRRTHRLPVRR